MRTKDQRIAAIVLTAVVLLLTAMPAQALSGTVKALLYWTTTGTANPQLTYEFQSFHEVVFTEYDLDDLLLPATLSGEIAKFGAAMDTCYVFSHVSQVALRCYVPGSAFRLIQSCPLASGVWTATSRAAVIPFQGMADATGQVFANCPPPDAGPGHDCLVATPSYDHTVVDLGTGLPLPYEEVAALLPVDLKRTGADGHGQFQLEEWAFVAVGSEGGIEIERASSDRYGSFLKGDPEPVLKSLPAPSLDGRKRSPETGRYLLIQGAGHEYKVPRPMVKLKNAPSPPRLDGSAGKVVVRAVFDRHGMLQEASTLAGDEGVGSALAERLEPTFVEGGEHRVALFAVFDLDQGEAELVSASPVVLKCCCNGHICV